MKKPRCGIKWINSKIQTHILWNNKKWTEIIILMKNGNNLITAIYSIFFYQLVSGCEWLRAAVHRHRDYKQINNSVSIPGPGFMVVALVLTSWIMCVSGFDRRPKCEKPNAAMRHWPESIASNCTGTRGNISSLKWLANACNGSINPRSGPLKWRTAFNIEIYRWRHWSLSKMAKAYVGAMGLSYQRARHGGCEIAQLESADGRLNCIRSCDRRKISH